MFGNNIKFGGGYLGALFDNRYIYVRCLVMICGEFSRCDVWQCLQMNLGAMVAMLGRELRCVI
jgi:hypothetical protein